MTSEGHCLPHPICLTDLLLYLQLQQIAHWVHLENYIYSPITYSHLLSSDIYLHIITVHFCHFWIEFTYSHFLSPDIYLHIIKVHFCHFWFTCWVFKWQVRDTAYLASFILWTVCTDRVYIYLMEFKQKYSFNILDHLKFFLIWWHSPFKGTVRRYLPAVSFYQANRFCS